MNADDPSKVTKEKKNSIFSHRLTIHRRWAIGLGLGLAMLLVAMRFEVFNIHKPGSLTENIRLAASPTMPKPGVNVSVRGNKLQEQRRAEKLYLRTGLTVEEMIKRFLDPNLDVSTRRLYARKLAHVGSPEVIAALMKMFPTVSPEQKAYLAQLIGSTGDPVAKDLLLPLLNDPDERVALAAVRGLSFLDSPEVSAKLAELLDDPQRSEAMRIEAAMGLGDIGDDTAREALISAFNKVSKGEKVATQILNSLGKFPFPRIEEVFNDYLSSPTTSPEMRVVTVEALSGSSTEAVPFLLGLAGDDDADVRAAAAWAISAHATANDIGSALAELVESEPDAEVRRRLYEALANQTGDAAGQLLPTILAEEDIAARVAGYNALGRAVGQNPASHLATAFDEKLVPELLKIATANNSLNIQMRAVFALRQARTASAQAALTQIAGSARPQIATAARNGLRRPNS